MKTADFKFELPKELIAKYPQIERSKCKLLVLNTLTGEMRHSIFYDLVNQLIPGDLLVLNNTRVIPAKLLGCFANGKKIEVFIERILSDHQALVYIRPNKLIEKYTRLILGTDLNVYAHVIDFYQDKYNKLFKIYFDDHNSNVLTILNNFGNIPIPPYLKRQPEKIDHTLYQTVYNLYPGSTAAPTAGLHFDTVLLDALLRSGVEVAFITLHIGSASFCPVRTNFIKNHVMHKEYIDVPNLTVDAILRCKKRKNRVIAVGTTVVKSLETAAIHSKNGAIIESFSGYAQTFIIPGYHFRIVDAVITNFHLSQSTLIMLVVAFAGYKNIFNAYYEAIKLQYKFLSYGDAMFITRNFY